MRKMRMVTTPEEFTRWVTSSPIGSRVVYYTGWLMGERMGPLRGNGKSEAYRTADKAWEFYTSGAVTLVQRRNGSEDYSYIAEIK